MKNYFNHLICRDDHVVGNNIKKGFSLWDLIGNAAFATGGWATANFLVGRVILKKKEE